MKRWLPVLLFCLLASACAKKPESPLQWLLGLIPPGETVFIDPQLAEFLPPEVKHVPLPVEFLITADSTPDPTRPLVPLPQVPGVYADQVRYMLVPGNSEPSWLGCAVAGWKSVGLLPSAPGDHGYNLYRRRDDAPTVKPGKVEPSPLIALPDGSLALEKTEVSYRQYVAFLNEARPDPSILIRWIDLGRMDNPIVRDGEGYAVCPSCADHPVAFVSFGGAEAYCRHLGRRLPTDGEWLRFAQGNDKRAYPWGDQDDVTQYANINSLEDGYVNSNPVDAFGQGAGPYGHLNLGGNAFEWTAGREGPVLRGGSWITGPEWTRNDRHESNFAYARNNHNGFRCAK